MGSSGRCGARRPSSYAPTSTSARYVRVDHNASHLYAHARPAIHSLPCTGARLTREGRPDRLPRGMWLATACLLAAWIARPAPACLQFTRPLLQKSKKVFAVAARFAKCIEKASIDEVRCPVIAHIPGINTGFVKPRLLARSPCRCISTSRARCRSGLPSSTTMVTSRGPCRCVCLARVTGSVIGGGHSTNQLVRRGWMDAPGTGMEWNWIPMQGFHWLTDRERDALIGPTHIMGVEDDERTDWLMGSTNGQRYAHRTRRSLRCLSRVAGQHRVDMT
jgi:hypothetical protein